MIIFWIILAVLLVFAGFYNSLSRSKNRIDEAASDIDVQLKRRFDLIPNLVETVKGYALHEKDIMENITKARARVSSAPTRQEKIEAENSLGRAISGFFAVAENYPDLKANQNFLQLQSDLTDTEDKIQAARRFYNANVRDYNTKLQVFPTNLIAQWFGFTKREYFGGDGEINEDERKTPKVSF